MLGSPGRWAHFTIRFSRRIVGLGGKLPAMATSVRPSQTLDPSEAFLPEVERALRMPETLEVLWRIPGFLQEKDNMTKSRHSLP